MDPELQEIVNSTQGPFQEVEAIIRLQNQGIYPQGVRVVAEFQNIVTCRLLKKDILPIYHSTEVASMKATKFVGVTIDVDAEINHTEYSYPKMNTTGPTGKGIIYGIIDWGADFAHPNFIDKNGSSRFICIWDQSHKDELPHYGYGKVYTREHINAALKEQHPYDALGFHPGRSDRMGLGSHACHVMDIAVGNGRMGKKGFAPEADIIFVHLSSKGASRLQNLGDSVRILEALDFMGRVAGEKKLVINMSLGRMGGSKDGTSLVEQGMDRFVEMKKNRIIVQSTGNYYNSKTHHSGIVRPGGRSKFSFYTERDDTTTNEMEVWYSGKDEFDIVLRHSKLEKDFVCSVDEHTDLTYRGELVGRIYSRTDEPNSKKNHINIFLYSNAPRGTWSVELLGKKCLDGRYHAYIERDSGCRSCQSVFHTQYVDKSHTTGTICNGFNSIVVGALDNTTFPWKVANFSSRGPTEDGRYKPDQIYSTKPSKTSTELDKNEWFEYGYATCKWRNYGYARTYPYRR